MAEQLETMKVAHPTAPGEYMVIDKRDFDWTIHQPFGQKLAGSKETATKSEEPTGGEANGSTQTPATNLDSESKSASESIIDPKVVRTQELEAMEAGAIRRIAEALGIPRPRSGGWAAAIPLIVEKEAALGK